MTHKTLASGVGKQRAAHSLTHAATAIASAVISSDREKANFPVPSASDGLDTSDEIQNIDARLRALQDFLKKAKSKKSYGGLTNSANRAHSHANAPRI